MSCVQSIELTFWKISRVHVIFFPKHLIRTAPCVVILIIGRMRQTFFGNRYQLRPPTKSSIASNSLLTLGQNKKKTFCHIFVELKFEMRTPYLSPISQAMNNKNNTHSMFKRGTRKINKSIESSVWNDEKKKLNELKMQLKKASESTKLFVFEWPKVFHRQWPVPIEITPSQLVEISH